jgi:hypothetical protein
VRHTPQHHQLCLHAPKYLCPAKVNKIRLSSTEGRLTSAGALTPLQSNATLKPPANFLRDQRWCHTHASTPSCICRSPQQASRSRQVPQPCAANTTKQPRRQHQAHLCRYADTSAVKRHCKTSSKHLRDQRWCDTHTHQHPPAAFAAPPTKNQDHVISPNCAEQIPQNSQEGNTKLTSAGALTPLQSRATAKPPASFWGISAGATHPQAPPGCICRFPLKHHYPARL